MHRIFSGPVHRLCAGIALAPLLLSVAACSTDEQEGQQPEETTSTSAVQQAEPVDIAAATLQEGEMLPHLRYANYGQDYAALSDEERTELARSQKYQEEQLRTEPAECAEVALGESFITALVAEKPEAANVVMWQPKPEDYTDNADLEAYSVLIADAEALGEHGALAENCLDYSATMPVGGVDVGYSVTQHFQNTAIDDVTLSGAEDVQAYSTVTWVDGSSAEEGHRTYIVRGRTGNVVVLARGIELNSVKTLAQAQLDRIAATRG
ncbi:hypothetical protein [Corynebacterium sp. TAE3-ERU30]|uniref:hypothetical protein n=1 Tax=Corynebacterium sp. TAE3-ERU30 TaxID=2849496 RepID=UPI001C467339|nr:hypothetical protein [Corynebacterium sp. TAE3-ERU30]MBV7282562.1 hypothetical protein [Corynebacterium sp. TAE3-ERU30]